MRFHDDTLGSANLAPARPISKIEAFKKRLGWKFNWVSSYGSDFNYDYHVSFTPEQMAKGKVEYNFDLVEFPGAEAPGISVFYKDKVGNIFHTYSTYARGQKRVSARTTISTLFPKAAMRMASPSPCRGSAIMIAMRAATWLIQIGR
jgi:predicted dithiol-disulfide oxidoreductase (DUF899 family)